MFGTSGTPSCMGREEARQIEQQVERQMVKQCAENTENVSQGRSSRFWFYMNFEPSSAVVVLVFLQIFTHSRGKVPLSSCVFLSETAALCGAEDGVVSLLDLRKPEYVYIISTAWITYPKLVYIRSTGLEFLEVP